MPDTPSAPRDSILPYPVGNRWVGFLNEYETVARVVKSEMRSVREWMASADNLFGYRVSVVL